MQISGNYKKFWGSDSWDIKIDYMYEISDDLNIYDIQVEFRNLQTNLFNRFEVVNLCSCVKLMRIFSEGFGISIYDRRLANWLEEYFNDNGQKIKSKILLNCLNEYNKLKVDKKVDVKVKNLMIVNKEFINSINYDPTDLLINFEDIYEQSSDAELIPLAKPLENVFSNPLRNSNIVYNLKGKKINGSYQNIEKSKIQSGEYKITKTLPTGSKITNIEIVEYLSNDFKATNIVATLFAPDGSDLGVFHPIEFKKDQYGLQITWHIDELKQRHYLEFTYTFYYQIPFIFTNVDENSEKKFISHLKINKTTGNKYEIIIPKYSQMNQLIQVEAYLPIEWEIQTILKSTPQLINKVIDLGSYQKIIFSGEFNYYINSEDILLSGNMNPVLSVFETITQAGSKLEKRIFRLNSLTDPLIMYKFNSIENEKIKIIEKYPSKSIIHSANTDNFEINKLDESFKEFRLYCNDKNDNIVFQISGVDNYNLEKSITSISQPFSSNNDELNLKMNFEKNVPIDDYTKDQDILRYIKNNSKEQYTHFRIRTFDFDIKTNNLIESNNLDSAFDDLKYNEINSIQRSDSEDGIESFKPKTMEKIEEKNTDNAIIEEIPPEIDGLKVLKTNIKNIYKKSFPDLDNVKEPLIDEIEIDSMKTRIKEKYLAQSPESTKVDALSSDEEELETLKTNIQDKYNNSLFDSKEAETPTLEDNVLNAMKSSIKEKYLAQLSDSNKEDDLSSDEEELETLKTNIQDKYDNSLFDSKEAETPTLEDNVLNAMKSSIKEKYLAQLSDSNKEDGTYSEEEELDVLKSNIQAKLRESSGGAETPTLEDNVLNGMKSSIKEKYEASLSNSDDNNSSIDEENELKKLKSKIIKDYSSIIGKEEISSAISENYNEIDEINDIELVKKSKDEEVIIEDSIANLDSEKLSETKSLPMSESITIKTIKDKKYAYSNISDEKSEKKISESSLDLQIMYLASNHFNSDGKIPKSILHNNSNFLLLNNENKLLEIENSNRAQLPLKIYIKIPPNERFMILLMNPDNFPSSHLYGGWKKTRKDKKFKFSVNKPGNWLFKLQFLESGDVYQIIVKK